MTKGLLVVVEGVNGAGKSSVIEAVVRQFESIERDVVVYKFPNRMGLYGTMIDRYLKGELTISSKYDVLHMFAANRKSVCKNIEQDIDSGKIVICDRYVFSAIAYHIPSHVEDPKNVRHYCNVIGYFDKDMPLPDVVYMIEGDHLSKRGIFHREIFHHNGDKAKKLKDMIFKVIRNYSIRFAVLKNYTNRMDEVVNYIVNDISMYL